MRRWGVVRIVLLALLAGGCQLAFGVAAVGPDGPPADASPVPGVLAHYAMDAFQSAPCLHDDSGNGHDGVCVGDPVSLGGGQFGKGYHLDGATRIQIPTTGTLAGGPFTIAGWFKYTGDPTPGMCPFNRLYGTARGNSWQVCIDPTQTAFFFTASGEHSVSAALLAVDAWHHLAIASSGTSVQTYIDGGLIEDDPWTLDFDAAPIELGADLDPAGIADPVTGAIDDVWIFDHALTAGEVVALESP